MIIINKKNLKRYEQLNEGFKKISLFMTNNDMQKISAGKYDLGDGDYVNILEPKKVCVENFVLKEMEVHRKYIDAQLVINGEEMLFYDFVDNCKQTIEYNDEKDCAFVMSSSWKQCRVKENDIMILFPEDAHNPIKITGETIGKKAVFKIKIR